jgi:hypothetical protein
MRVYIQDIRPGENTLKPINEYTFTESLDDARSWETKESAEIDRSSIESHKVTIKTLDRRIVFCTDFRVEQRSRGVFVISCEHPHE